MGVVLESKKIKHQKNLNNISSIIRNLLETEIDKIIFGTNALIINGFNRQLEQNNNLKNKYINTKNKILNLIYTEIMKKYPEINL